MLAITVVVVSCAPGLPEAAAGGGTLTRAMTSEPANLDPQGPANSGLSLVLPYVFDTLITQQRDGKYVGLLAESWQVSADGKSVDVKLRNGVKFHDGSPLNADAVVFTFKRFEQFGQKSPIAGDIAAISRIEAVDDLTVRFSFDKPTATFFSALAMPYAGILSPAAVKEASGEIGDKPVGTGPFELAEWKRGASMTLVRNPDYEWGTPEAENRGPAHFEKLVFKVIPDPNTQVSALETGDLDVVFLSEPAHVAKLKDHPAIHLERSTTDALIYLGYNCARAPFDEVKVRQALSAAIDKDEIVKTALDGLGDVAGTPLTPSLLGYNPDLGKYGPTHDPARATALLAEAGFTRSSDGTWQHDGRRLAGKLLTSNRAPNEAIATLIQSQLKEIGIPVEIQQLDSTAVMQATSEGSFDLLLWRYTWNDPDALNIYLSTSRIRQTNRVFYSSQKADALFERGLRELDPEKRIGIYEEAQQVILADVPLLPLYTPVEEMALRDRVKGVKMGALGRMLVNDVTLD